MTTHISDEILCAYLDNELDANTRASVDRALAQDAQLRDKLAQWSGQTTSLQDAFKVELDDPVPAAWLELVRQPTEQKSAVPAKAPMPAPKAHTNKLSWTEQLMRWMPSPRFATGLAFAVILGVFVGHDIIPRLNMDGQLVRLASVAHHVYSPDKRQPVEVKSEDPTLTAWISKRLGTKVLAPNVVGFRFMGGRLLAGAEEPAAQFMYEEASGKRLTVFVRTEGAAGRSTKPQCSDYRGVSVCFWYANGVAYALAGEVTKERLSPLAESAAASTRQ